MKRHGCSIIFVNNDDMILLFLRDDIPGLPYANMWDFLGGHVELHETPEDCIVREMKEEIAYFLSDFKLFRVYDFYDRLEFVFWRKENFDINNITLTEGQCLRWFSREKIGKITLAYGFNQVAEDFFNESPHHMKQKKRISEVDYEDKCT